LFVLHRDLYKCFRNKARKLPVTTRLSCLKTLGNFICGFVWSSLSIWELYIKKAGINRRKCSLHRVFYFILVWKQLHHRRTWLSWKSSKYISCNCQTEPLSDVFREKNSGAYLPVFIQILSTVVMESICSKNLFWWPSLKTVKRVYLSPSRFLSVVKFGDPLYLLWCLIKV